MKIEKIVLKNFSAIKNAMNANILTIDFGCSRNNICLIIGPNGSGKTTLLSLLTPFASLGNLDIRDGNEMILEKKEGYKELHIRDGEDYYVIKHFYTPHDGKSHTTKSYIEKNGCELNTNGNVTSFKIYVKTELNIEPDYLKLIRLGNNVTSLISLSETERKNFMSKLLDEIGISLNYYKKVNADLRQLKQMIALDVEKLKRLRIDDINSAQSTMDYYKKEIANHEEDRDRLNSIISVLEHEIGQIEDPEFLREKIVNTTKKIKKMDLVLEKKDQLESNDAAYYAQKIATLEKRKIKLEDSMHSMDQRIEKLISSIDQSENQYRLVMVQWQKEEQSDHEIEKLRQEVNRLDDLLSKRERVIEEYLPKYSAPELGDFIVFLKNQQMVADRTYEFGENVIKKIISLIRQKRDVTQYITAGMMSLNEQASEENSLLLMQLKRRYNFSKEIECMDINCQPLQLWNHIKGLLHDREVDEKENYDFYKDMELAYHNIKNLLQSFSSWESIILKLPEKVKNGFTIEVLLKKIEKLDKIYSEKTMQDLLSEITEYESTLKLKSQRDEISDSIARFAQLSNLEYLRSQKAFYEKKLEEEKDELRSLRIENSEYEEKLIEISHELETLDILRETFEKYDELSELLLSLEEDYKKYRENLKEIGVCRKDLEMACYKIDSLRKNMQELSNAMVQYEVINKELANYEEIYDEMVLVKESLSSKKGMPLYHIKHYLGNTEEITNELLDIAYDGEISIDPFHISPTEFRIPFHIRGKQMKDVKYASQGELSFLSIALSFGLSAQSLSKYNIMLLDEIDGPLDIKNREKFIRILENQIDRIGSEQNFLITHNNMFSSYPVDIIDLSFSDNRGEFRLANYIPVELS